MYKDVVKFIEACDQEVNDTNARLYHNLIDEEVNEFFDAREPHEELDACMDMIWVILGYCHMNGWDVEGAWNEVTQTNLSKIDKETGKVRKGWNGKVLKPEGWKEPNFKQFIK